MLDTGEKIPDFELPNQEGEPFRPSDLAGRRWVLFAYPKADTPGCTKQACGLAARMPEFGDGTVVGLSPDPPEALARWKKKAGLPYDLLSDPEHEVLESLGAWGEKSMYGRKYMGVIRSHWVIGEDGTVLDARVKVSPAKSVELASRVVAG